MSAEGVEKSEWEDTMKKFTGPGSIKKYQELPLMAEWLEQASQWHEMYCRDLEVMSLNPGRAN